MSYLQFQRPTGTSVYIQGCEQADGQMLGREQMRQQLQIAPRETLRRLGEYAQSPLPRPDNPYYHEAVIGALSGFSTVDLKVPGLPLIDNGSVAYNTILRSGTDAQRFKALLGAYAESGVMISPEDRTWIADVVEAGVKEGSLRQEMSRCSQPDRQPSGWLAVAQMLRESDGEPVVATCSLGCTFPYLPDERGGFAGSDRAFERFDRLDAAKQWDKAIKHLLKTAPWRRINREIWGEFQIIAPVATQDLIAAAS